MTPLVAIGGVILVTGLLIWGFARQWSAARAAAATAEAALRASVERDRRSREIDQIRGRRPRDRRDLGEWLSGDGDDG